MGRKVDEVEGDLKRYLLISRVGVKSLHGEWIFASGFRNFDVLLSAYDERVQPVSAQGVYYELRKGPKVEGYNGIINDNSDLLSRYEYICFFDEDLLADVGTLNQMFSISEKLNLKISQPSLTWSSYFTYAALLRQPGSQLRYINYIEMMCPVFRRDVLVQVAPLYAMGAESGIDLIWCNLAFESERDFAVLDSVSVTHTEPVGGRKVENGFVAGKTYEDDIFRVLSAFNLPWISCVPYCLVTRSGRQVTSRFWKLLFALSLFFAVPFKPGRAGRLRSVLVHLRHLLCRRPFNVKLRNPVGILDNPVKVPKLRSEAV